MSENKNEQIMPKQGEICWTELTTKDATKAKAFYKELFGWEFIEHPVGIEGYTCFKTGDKEAGGIMQIPSEGEYSHMPTRWLSYIYVDDIEAAADKAKSLGAVIKVPVTDVSDFGRFVVLMDPTGAEIAFWQFIDKS